MSILYYNDNAEAKQFFWFSPKTAKLINLHHMQCMQITYRVVNLCKRWLNASAQTINPGKPAQSARAGLGRNFCQSVNVVQIKGPCHLMILFVVEID